VAKVREKDYTAEDAKHDIETLKEVLKT